jgi:hypothetical protein
MCRSPWHEKLYLFLKDSIIEILNAPLLSRGLKVCMSTFLFLVNALSLAYKEALSFFYCQALLSYKAI